MFKMFSVGSRSGFANRVCMFNRLTSVQRFHVSKLVFKKHTTHKIPVTNEIFECFKSKDFIKSMVVYDSLEKTNLTFADSKTLQGFLNLCHKAEHLPKALQIINDMTANKFEMGERICVVLLRCYADANDINKSLEILTEMQKSNIKIKMRLLEPVMECACRNNDFNTAIQLLSFAGDATIGDSNMRLVSSILEMVGRNPNMLSVDGNKLTVNELLQQSGNRYLGMVSKDIATLVSVTTNRTVDEITILVEEVHDIANVDIDTSNLTVDGTATAMVSQFTSPVGVIGHRTVVFSNNPLFPTGQRDPEWRKEKDLPAVKPTSQLVSQKYIVASEVQKLQSFNPHQNNLRGHRARAVQISSNTCRCPNCQGLLAPMKMTSGEKKLIRDSLASNFTAVSHAEADSLKNFANWLDEQRRRDGEFDFVVDGANVTGIHDTKKLINLVKQLNPHNDKRVLIFLPKFHFMDSKCKDLIGEVDEADRDLTRSQINNKYQQVIRRAIGTRNKLYAVATRSMDDWYWIYATVHEGREKDAYVITNDLLRDHRPAFIEERVFIRWRAAHIVHFDRVEENEVKLKFPGNHFREIQQAQSGSTYWHIPSTDQSHWLCFSTEPVSENSLSVAVTDDTK